LAAVADPEPPAAATPDDAIRTVPPPDETLAALWHHAGLQRDPAGLSELLDDPFPLARLIGASCLAREESRGAHQRLDHPDTDPALDRMHTLVEADARPSFEQWT
jgi:L-aspartate oxidase